MVASRKSSPLHYATPILEPLREPRGLSLSAMVNTFTHLHDESRYGGEPRSFELSELPRKFGNNMMYMCFRAVNTGLPPQQDLNR
jgi:hypothetical protein